MPAACHAIRKPCGKYGREHPDGGMRTATCGLNADGGMRFSQFVGGFSFFEKVLVSWLICMVFLCALDWCWWLAGCLENPPGNSSRQASTSTVTARSSLINWCDKRGRLGERATVQPS
jgi:hypothetical protein